MKPNVVLYFPAPQPVVDLLSEHFQLTTFSSVDDTNRSEFLEAAAEADGLIGMGLPVPTSDLPNTGRLKAAATISSGYDKFDVAELTARKVVLMNLSEPLTETVADQAFALMMSAARRVTELDRRIRAGEWTQHAGREWFGIDIHGKTLGIIGMGRIGAAIARRGALGCGMKILYTARSPKQEAEEQFGAQRRTQDELLRESDFVCIVVPLSAETNKLIGARELGLMKKTAILVNVARGQVIDENALIKALEQNQIYGAGLDVFEEEPISQNSPLLKLQNVVLAPHVGSATDETRDAMAMYAAETLVGYLCRGEARNVINPAALKSE